MSLPISAGQGEQSFLHSAGLCVLRSSTGGVTRNEYHRVKLKHNGTGFGQFQSKWKVVLARTRGLGFGLGSVFGFEGRAGRPSRFPFCHTDAGPRLFSVLVFNVAALVHVAVWGLLQRQCIFGQVNQSCAGRSNIGCHVLSNHESHEPSMKKRYEMNSSCAKCLKKGGFLKGHGTAAQL